jgi:hypothetical protein
MSIESIPIECIKKMRIFPRSKMIVDDVSKVPDAMLQRNCHVVLRQALKDILERLSISVSEAQFHFLFNLCNGRNYEYNSCIMCALPTTNCSQKDHAVCNDLCYRWNLWNQFREKGFTFFGKSQRNLCDECTVHLSYCFDSRIGMRDFFREYLAYMNSIS